MFQIEKALNKFKLMYYAKKGKKDLWKVQILLPSSYILHSLSLNSFSVVSGSESESLSNFIAVTSYMKN